jgi:adiponectin receptor
MFSFFFSFFLVNELTVQIGVLAFLTGFVVVHPRLQSQKWRLLRLSTFVATGLSAFAPIIHAASIFPYDQLDQQAGLRYYYLEGFVIVIGVLFYAVRHLSNL